MMMTETENTIGKAVVCFNVCLIFSLIAFAEGWAIQNIPNFVCYASIIISWVMAYKTERFFESWACTMPAMLLFCADATDYRTVWGLFLMTGFTMGIMEEAFGNKK